jgi:hypothetical protein
LLLLLLLPPAHVQNDLMGSRRISLLVVGRLQRLTALVG